MTAPRPEAVELAARLLALTGLDAFEVPEASKWASLIDAALTAARADERERVYTDPRSEEWAVLDEVQDKLETLTNCAHSALTRYEEMRQNVMAFGGGLKTGGFVKDCDEAMDALAAAIRAMEGR